MINCVPNKKQSYICSFCVLSRGLIYKSVVQVWCLFSCSLFNDDYYYVDYNDHLCVISISLDKFHLNQKRGFSKNNILIESTELKGRPLIAELNIEIMTLKYTIYSYIIIVILCYIFIAVLFVCLALYFVNFFLIITAI